MPALFELARPQTWADVAGQEKAVAQVQRVLKRGWGGRAWWVSGMSGAGKTSIARLIANDGADTWATWEIDAQDCTLDFVRDMVEDGFACRSLGQGGKCYIINEAHTMRAMIADRFLTALEAIPDHACVIFTSSKPLQASLFGENHDASPLYSRCIVVKLQDGPQTRQALAARAHAVAKANDMDGLPTWAYEAALERLNGNLRAVLQRVEAGQIADVAREEIGEYLRRPMKDQEPAKRALLQGRLAELEGK